MLSNSAQTGIESESLSISLPQRRYANDVQVAEEPTFVKSGERIGKYANPPVMGKESGSEESLPDRQSPPLRKTNIFESIDYSGFKKTDLDLPQARWNPLFDQSPPLSERSPQPLIDNSTLVPVEPETVQVMKVATEPFINTKIDSSQLTPVKKREITVLIQADSIVSVGQDFP